MDTLDNFSLVDLRDDRVIDMGQTVERAGGYQLTNVGKVFFSQRNMSLLQEALRYRVFVESNGKYTIGRQSNQELGLVMRSVYLGDTSGRDMANRHQTLIEHVRMLNTSVIDFCVPRVLEEVRMYKHYLKDVSTMPIPIDRGTIATSKGDRVLEIKQFM